MLERWLRQGLLRADGALAAGVWRCRGRAPAPQPPRARCAQEWVDGIKLTDKAAMAAAGLDVVDFVDVGIECTLEQLLGSAGYFHADPHPGARGYRVRARALCEHTAGTLPHEGGCCWWPACCTQSRGLAGGFRWLPCMPSSIPTPGPGRACATCYLPP